jgi:ABC-type transport system involved in multi-copper enzyme maturation permease subunit
VIIEPLLLRVWRWQAVRVALIAAALVAWGWLLPFVYSQFSGLIKELIRRYPIFEQMSQFGSGNLFSLGGTLTLGTQHPIVIALLGVIAIGTGALAIAGERQRGTLEVLLARPLDRRAVFMTHYAALFGLLMLLIAALLIGMVVGAATQGMIADIALGTLPLVWVNWLFLWLAFAAFSLAASATFDRTGPAIGLSLAYLLVNYFLEILGSLWTDVAWSQEYSLFHHFQVSEIIAGAADPADIIILVVAIAIPLAWGVIVFPRRDLAAPS